MIILPAIDIHNGSCVRLYKGDYSTAEVVAQSAVETAKSFEKDGADFVHMVDLDGAKDACLKNSQLIISVAKSVGIPIEIGGGIRNMQAVEHYLENGVSRVILGSAALKNFEFTKEAVNAYGEKIAIGIDAKNGFVSTEGWLDTSSVTYIELAKKMESIGVKYIIFTDISKDGTLEGANLEQLNEINNAVSCNIIASGGIKDINDIKNLCDLKLYGAICGKSLYSGTLSLKEAVSVAAGN